jgi:hypothetical protein
MGYGSWSAGRRFTLDQSAPAASELKAPDDIEVQSPYMVFDWEDVPDATWYRLWINKDGAYHYDKWVQSASTWTSWWDVTSYPGSYQWWVQSYGDNGYGDWSDDTEYWVGVPGMVTEQTPVGTTVTSARPAFTWTSDSEATWYQVYLSYNGGYHWSEWVQGTNTWTPGWNMQDYPGYYEWWVQTYGANGYGPWSDGAVFVISVPGQATLSSPSGSQTSGYPTFSWSAVTGATWYQIYLEKDGVYHWSEWIEGDNSWTPWWNMNDYPGEYQWWIQTWGAAGYGPWSESLKYTMGADLQ